jgi:lysine 2,3-aminomutase
MSFTELFPNNLKNLDSTAINMQFLISEDENNPNIQEMGLVDPIGDEKNFVAPQLIHRYQNRALFLPTNKCPVHCRYCFRRNEFETDIFDKGFQETIAYLNQHKEIEEIIFTGGDPFMLSNTQIQDYLDEFSRVEHIKYIRFHTRTPVTLPARMNIELLSILNEFSQRYKIIMAIHTNHIDELTEEVKEVLKSISKLPVHFISQTVLLKKVNSSSQVLSALFHELLDLGCTPYYLHHPDKVKGAMHFYLSKEEGLEIYTELRQLLPGWALPQYIIDDPSGAGKEPVRL